MDNRLNRRKNKGAASGKVVPLHKRIEMDEHKNDGGFYQGMPGCLIDKNGNRKMIDFVTLPTGQVNAYIFAHPIIVKRAIEQALKDKELGNLLTSSFLDHLFKNKFNPLYGLVKLCYRCKRVATVMRINRKQKRAEKESKA